MNYRTNVRTSAEHEPHRRNHETFQQLGIRMGKLYDQLLFQEHPVL